MSEDEPKKPEPSEPSPIEGETPVSPTPPEATPPVEAKAEPIDGPTDSVEPEYVDELAEEVTKKGWRFLKSVWFWIIAGPVNMIIAALVIAWAFPFLFIGFPAPPAEVSTAKKAVVIDKYKQAAYAYEDGKLRYRFVILTGKGDHETPEGKFAVTRKIKDYHSREYDSPMPNSVFFIDSRGIAMHASFAVGPKWCLKHFLGRTPLIGSHGCVRLTPYGSWKMFRFTEKGTPVLVIDKNQSDSLIELVR